MACSFQSNPKINFRLKTNCANWRLIIDPVRNAEFGNWTYNHKQNSWPVPFLRSYTLLRTCVVQKRVVFLAVISNFVSRLLECQNWHIISKLLHQKNRFLNLFFAFLKWSSVHSAEEFSCIRNIRHCCKSPIVKSFPEAFPICRKITDLQRAFLLFWALSLWVFKTLFSLELY